MHLYPVLQEELFKPEVFRQLRLLIKERRSSPTNASWSDSDSGICAQSTPELCRVRDSTLLNMDSSYDVSKTRSPELNGERDSTLVNMVSSLDLSKNSTPELHSVGDSTLKITDSFVLGAFSNGCESSKGTSDLMSASPNLCNGFSSESSGGSMENCGNLSDGCLPSPSKGQMEVGDTVYDNNLYFYC